MNRGVPPTIRPSRPHGCPPHIGILCAGWRPDLGGVESHTADLSRGLLGRGYSVSALCLDTSGTAEPFTRTEDRQAGVDVRRVAYGWGDITKLLDLMAHPGLEAELDAWIDEVRPDLVHVHHLTGWGGRALLRLHKRGVPCVMTLHDYWMIDPRAQLFGSNERHLERFESEDLLPGLRRVWPHLLPSGGAPAEGSSGESLDGDEGVHRAYLALSKRMLSLAGRLLLPSRAAGRIFERFGVAPEHLEVCENGIDVGQLRAALEFEFLRERPRDPDVVVLGVLGSVLPSKGVLELAEAVVASGIETLRLEVHGAMPAYHGDSSYVDRLVAFSEGEPRIELCGPFDHCELPRVLSGLDGVAAPSLWEEVFGLSVREARAVGLPVLVSDAGGLPEVTDGDRAGRVVPRYDREAWIAALREFALEPELRRAWAAHPFVPRSSAQMVDELCGHYAQVLAEHEKPAV